MAEQEKYPIESLPARLAAGDTTAMHQLFFAYYQRLTFYAQSVTANRTEAEDTAQEALTIIWQQRKNWEHKSIGQLESFLFTIVRNRSYNFLKHLGVIKKHEEAVINTVPADDRQADLQRIEEEVLHHIFEEINNLPDNYAQLLRLVFIEGLDTTAIAARLGITPNNVRNQKARALDKLRTALLHKQLYMELAGFFLFFRGLL